MIVYVQKWFKIPRIHQKGESEVSTYEKAVHSSNYEQNRWDVRMRFEEGKTAKINKELAEGVNGTRNLKYGPSVAQGLTSKIFRIQKIARRYVLTTNV